MRSIVRVVVVGMAMLMAAETAGAQTPASPWALNVSAGRVNFDLSGTGDTAGFSVRATRFLSPHLSFELRSLFARPCQQFQDCKAEGPATLIAPEAQLQYHWTAGRIEPYLGAGLGTAAVRSSSLGTRWDPTISFAAGTAVRVTDRLALTGEFRLRGHEWRFVGTTTEISAGVAWHVPAF
jgi:outer membrane protein W